MQSDAELLAGGADGFGDFYARHVEAVTAYVVRRAGRGDIAFDVVAETFARALEHRAQYDGRRGPAVAWLLGIARNLLADAVARGRVADVARRRLGMARVELDDEQIARIEERGTVDLRAALHGLSDEQREAIVARVVAEQPYPEIAARVGCSEQVVRQRVSRGLAAMRRSLET